MVLILSYQAIRKREDAVEKHEHDHHHIQPTTAENFHGKSSNCYCCCVFATKKAPRASPLVFPTPRPFAFSVSVFSAAIIPDVFLAKSTGHRRHKTQKKSFPRTVARGVRGL